MRRLLTVVEDQHTRGKGKKEYGRGRGKIKNSCLLSYFAAA